MTTENKNPVTETAEEIPPPPNKILISSHGSGIAVGVEGDKDFIERQTNRFFNFGAVGPDARFYNESDTFGYFLTSKIDMITALSAENFVRFLQDGTSKAFKGKPQAMQEECDKLAEETFNAFEREHFMSRRRDTPAHVGAVAQNGRAEVWEEDFKIAK